MDGGIPKLVEVSAMIMEVNATWAWAGFENLDVD